MKKMFLLLVVLLFPLMGWSAETEDATFVSLTRRASPLQKLPSNISVITADEIKQHGAATLGDVLDLLPSIDVARSGSLGTFSSIRLRGTPSSSQMQILVDDQPWGGFAADQLVDVSVIPVGSIERVEVVRGGSSTLFGANTTGGVVHIITKKHSDKEPALSVSLERREHNTRLSRVSAGARHGLLDAHVSLDELTSDGFQKNADVDHQSGSINVGASFSGGSRLSMRVSSLEHESGVPQGTRVPFHRWNGEREKAPANTTKRSLNERTDGQVRLNVPAGRNQWQALAFASRSEYASRLSAGLFDPDFSRVSRVAGHDLRFIGDGGLTAGAAYERDDYRDNSGFTHHLDVWGLYVEQEWNREKWTFHPAFRFDRNENFGNQYNPRLTLVYRPFSLWAISANAARSYRAPSFFDLFFDIPGSYVSNRRLRPESGWTYDLGQSWTFSRHHQLLLTGFFTRIKDRITGINTDNDAPNDTNANLSRSETMGVEFESKNAWGPVQQSINYSFIRSRGFQSGKTTFVDLPVTPDHMLNVKLAVTLPVELTWSNAVQYAGKQFQDFNGRGVVLPSYGVWNSRLTKSWKSAEFFVGVNNLLDRHYTESFDFDPTTFDVILAPQPDRTYLAGLTVHVGKVD